MIFCSYPALVGVSKLNHFPLGLSHYAHLIALTHLGAWCQCPISPTIKSALGLICTLSVLIAQVQIPQCITLVKLQLEPWEGCFEDPVCQLKGREWQLFYWCKEQNIGLILLCFLPIKIIIIIVAQSTAFYVFSNVIFSIYCTLKSVLASVLQKLLKSSLGHLVCACTRDANVPSTWQNATKVCW